MEKIAPVKPDWPHMTHIVSNWNQLLLWLIPTFMVRPGVRYRKMVDVKRISERRFDVNGVILEVRAWSLVNELFREKESVKARIESTNKIVHRQWDPHKSADAAGNCSDGNLVMSAVFQCKRLSYLNSSLGEPAPDSMKKWLLEEHSIEKRSTKKQHVALPIFGNALRTEKTHQNSTFVLLS